ncbi:GRRM system radical SAM/SPASM domain protein [soil metagenome]
MVLQPSPFCNINCDYCYLPDRTLTHRMSSETLARTVQEIFASDLISEQVTFVWHAGEPLAVPIAWYEEALDLIARSAPPQIKIIHSFQSNGTLINERWCEFIKSRGIYMGLSIDGPEHIHDAHRKTRGGKGSHAQAMRGAVLLQQHDIDFHVIAVVTRDSLGHADEVFDFFENSGFPFIGFNVEELEGANTTSTLDSGADEKISEFFHRIFARQKSSGGRIRVREFDSALQRILANGKPDADKFVYANEQVRPFGILNVDWQGNFSTFSPELLGFNAPEYGEFSFGSVHTSAFQDSIQTPKFQKVLADIQAGVEKCRSECAYFELCGGGAPANKYFENGGFASSETSYCRSVIKLPINIVMHDLEKSLNLPQPATVSE